MTNSTLTFFFLMSWLAVPVHFCAAESKAPTKQELARSFQSKVAPLVQKYCIQCHGPKKQNAEVSFHQFRDAEAVAKDRGTWERALEMLDSKMMPPDGNAQPTDKERRLLIEWIETKLFHVDCDLPRDPGRVTIRRLNRSEYNNTIRDLVGVDFKPAKDFPSDDVGEGFDNIGDVLSLSPLLFEKYMDAAEQIAATAILARDPSTARKQFREREKLQVTGGGRLGEYGLYGLYSSGSVFAEFDFPRDGEYVLQVAAGAEQAGPEIAKMTVSLGGKNVKTFEVKATRDAIKPYEVRLAAKKGKQRMAAAFINDFYNPKDPDPKQRDRNLYIGSLQVVGPVDINPDEIPATHKEIVVARPSQTKSLRAAALGVLRPFVSKAFRRPVADDELAPYVNLVELATKHDETYERGIQVAVAAVLVSPQFLFRVESDPVGTGDERAKAIDDYQLATRLSYFLWSSMPDDELFALAAKGTLHQEKVLITQVERMLRDKKSAALVDNFAAQWLNLRNLDEVTPDPDRFGTFDDALRRDLRQETLLFFESVMREDRSVMDFLDGQYTFVNSRLAEHYGLPKVTGDGFQRVSLSNQQRGGILTHGSVLTLTSEATRTSPVKRGKWIMENILGTPPPEPPPNVPDLAKTQAASPSATLRQQLEIHRKDQTCAVCHVKMDALGFGFENFDAIGRWRDKDGDAPIDASGKLPSGETFSKPRELIQILRKQQDQFSRSLTKKMLTYALGRGLEYYDRCAVEQITDALKKNDYRFSTLVTEIVKSEPFRMRRSTGGKP